MAENLRTRLAEISGVTLRDLGRDRSALVSFTVDGMDASAVRGALGIQGINIGANGISYTPLDMQARGLATVARASISYLNTDAEIELLVKSIAALVRRRA